MSELYTIYAYPEDGRRTLDTFDTLALAGLALNSEENGINPAVWDEAFGLPEGETEEFLSPLYGAMGMCHAKAIVREFRTISEEVELYEDFLSAVGSLVQWYYIAWLWADETGVPQPLTEVASYLAISMAEGREPASLCLSEGAYAQTQAAHNDYIAALLTLDEIAEFIPDDEGPCLIELSCLDG